MRGKWIVLIIGALGAAITGCTPLAGVNPGNPNNDGYFGAEGTVYNAQQNPAVTLGAVGYDPDTMLARAPEEVPPAQSGQASKAPSLPSNSNRTPSPAN